MLGVAMKMKGLNKTEKEVERAKDDEEDNTMEMDADGGRVAHSGGDVVCGLLEERRHV